jgi:acetoin utilization deacetylase AcuC-like enzyme
MCRSRSRWTKTPPAIDESELRRVHTPEYIEVVRQLSASAPIMDAHRWGFSPYGDNPPFVGMWEAALAYTRATVAAAYAVRDGAPLAINITGGLHHALPNRASGFCIFNDPAIAVHILRERFERVAYLDIDLHHGDGVQWIFYRDPSVLTVSIHEGGRWLFPGRGEANELGEGAAEGTSINIPLAPYTDDALWQRAFEAVVPRAFERFQPEALVLQMGCDPHFLDPLGHLCLTAQGSIEQYQFSESHPLKPQRLALLRALMEAYGLTAHLDWQTPPAIDESELRRVHMPESAVDDPLLQVPPASRGNQAGTRLGSPREAGGTYGGGQLLTLAAQLV